MSSRKHWTETLADELKAEIGQMSQAAITVFGESRRAPKKPSKKAQLAAFLQMPRAQRQQMFAQMQPEEYAQFMQQNMMIAHQLLGPTAAQNLASYMYSDSMDEEDVNSIYEHAQGFLQGAGGMDEEVLLGGLLDEEED